MVILNIFTSIFTQTKKSTGLLALCSASIIVDVASMWKLLSIEAIPPALRVVSGLAIAVDPYGRTINASDYFDSKQNQMISCMPIKGVATIYSKIRDTFAWLSILEDER
jgi:apolipoprotein N-acyltransferase